MEFDAKLYEAAALEHEKLAPELKKGFEIVAELVKSRKRIIVGGMAIDLLMREKGEQLYPDELASFPDIDILTPNNLKDVQDLANIFYDNNYPEVSAISAIHVLTRKCRISGRVMLDATYTPPNVYEKIPYLELSNGFRVIHPLYQKLDQHMLLSKLYTDPPRESYQNRLRKDIKRYNLLDDLYPVEPVKESIKLTKVKISNSVYPFVNETPSVLHGYAAYAALIQSAKAMLGDKWNDVEKDNEIIITDAYFDGDEYVFESCVNSIHLLIDSADDNNKPKHFDSYEPLLDLIPDKWVSKNVELWRYTGILLSVGVGKIGDVELILPSAQYVLMFLLTMHFFGEDQYKNINLLLYCSLRKLLIHLEPLYKDDDNSPFFIPTQTIGSVNLSQSAMILLLRIQKNLGENVPELLCIPSNYWPATSKEVKHYDYESCEVFRKGGNRIGEL